MNSIKRLCGVGLWNTPPIVFCFAQTADKQVVGTDAETTLLASGVGSVNIAANTLLAGTTYRVRLMGYYDGASTQTLKLTLYLGATPVYVSAAVQPYPGSGGTSGPWWAEFTFTCRTVGGFGTVMAQLASVIWRSSTAAPVQFETKTTAPVTVSTIVDQAIDVTATYAGTGNAGNKFTCTNLTVERIST